MSFTPDQWAQLVFFANSSLIALALTTYILYVFPSMRALTTYGKGNEIKDNINKFEISAVKFLVSLQVPKSWFLHFYIFASALSWMQLTFHWNIILLLLAIQCTRRLYDQLLAPPTNAKMNIIHYLIGYIFYIDENIGAGNAHVTSNMKIIVPAVMLFATGWILQFQVHMHLFSLKKYTMPHMALFSKCACPHYLAESLMYLAILVLDVSNSVAWSTLLWIVLGLGVASQQSKQFYATKFPGNPKLPKYGMIPYVW
jgi:3-oxo-5-alpha-steroid 4-dehydrogenase 3 / polyprenol reductase